MPFRLFADDSKTFSTHIAAAKAAIEKGDPGYVWFGDKDLPPKWIGLHPPANKAVANLLFSEFQKVAEQPQPKPIAGMLLGNDD